MDDRFPDCSDALGLPSRGCIGAVLSALVKAALYVVPMDESADFPLAEGAHVPEVVPEELL
jgi:hypothetical protein